MTRKRIALACQGGGSQCAFVAGALGTLFARGIQERFQVVGLSGTSGGAFTAALAWLGLLEQADGDRTPIEERILACWQDLTAQTPQEIAFDAFCVETERMVERGMLPSVASSPTSTRFSLWSQSAAFVIARPEFTDLRALLEKHLDFGAMPSLSRPGAPVLQVGAADVLEGTFKIFSSARREITIEALLASAAIPNLFPAVHVDGHAYWDGIFSTNPPVASLLQRAHMGATPLPEEIWVIQVNRVRQDEVPETPGDIFDRRNQLAGNLSLRHELQLIALANMLLREHAFTDQFRARFGVDATEPVQVRFIRMSSELMDSLDYPSKLSRQPAHIARLIADGEAQATGFLASLGEEERRHELPAAEPPVESP